MRKLIFNIFWFLGSFGLLFLVSCGDDNDDIFNDGPSIDVQVNGEDSGPFDANLGETIVLNLDVSDEDGVDSVVVKKYVDGTEVMDAEQVIYPSTTGGTLTQDVEFELDQTDAGGEVTYEIIAYDTEGNSNTETVVVNVNSVASYTTVLLFAPLADETSESFFSSATGETYSVNDVVAAGNEPVSETIDIGYYYGDANNATLASPQHIHDLAIYDLNDWNTLNTTQFRRTTITESEFLENEGNEEYISDAYDNADAQTGAQFVSNLAVGDVVAFKVDNGDQSRAGIIRVSNIEPGDGVDNFIEIDVLVSFLPEGTTGQ